VCMCRIHYNTLPVLVSVHLGCVCVVYGIACSEHACMSMLMLASPIAAAASRAAAKRLLLLSAAVCIVGGGLMAHSEKLSLLVRNENAGMDLGSHNVTLEWLASRGQLSRYAYYIFINSSAKGPFMPSWVPPEWHWTAAFLSRFQSPPYVPGAVAAPASTAAGTTQQLPQQQLARPPAVHAVGASLVCLPEGDAGGPGPRLETWAFALDQDGLAVAVDAGVFIMRGCKLCPSATDGVVVGGEYGLTKAMFAAGYNVATLMSRYAPGIDWRDRRHWQCNNNVHPSRAGTYDGVSMHPFETLFVKSSWHVADVYTRRYAAWTLGHMLGRPGTDGVTDRRLYLYAISERAQHPKDLESAYRPVLE
jgi:hypothetical protein